jgi:hypothetical protein
MKKAQEVRMVKWTKYLVLSSFLALNLSACGGEKSPLTWNTNLDVNCKPQDFLDTISAKLAPESFWRNQEYDMGSLLKLSQTNTQNVSIILDDAHAQQGEFFSRAEQSANDLGLSGKEKREHVKANMDRYAAEVKALEDQLKVQKDGMEWVRKCQRVVQTELGKLQLMPVPYDPSKRPM